MKKLLILAIFVVTPFFASAQTGGYLDLPQFGNFSPYVPNQQSPYKVGNAFQLNVDYEGDIEQYRENFFGIDMYVIPVNDTFSVIRDPSGVVDDFLFRNLLFEAAETPLLQANGLPTGAGEAISIKMTPEYPGPNEEINVALRSFSTDLDRSIITWSVDGVPVAGGLGKKEINGRMSETGEETVIRAVIETEEGMIVERIIEYTPSDVILVAEPKTYIPPFYKGRSIFTKESEILISTLPVISRDGNNSLNPNDLIYTWKVNSTVDGAKSGVGQQSYVYKGERIVGPLTIKVTVEDPRSSLVAVGSIDIEEHSPEVLVYENNPVLGLISIKNIAGNVTISRPEVQLDAIPYFFSVVNRNSQDIRYEWSISNNEVANSSSIVLANEDEQRGSIILSLVADIKSKMLHRSATSFVMDFLEPEQSNSF